MNYELLQRHGAVNVEYEEPAAEPWLSPIGDVGNAGIYNIPKSPNVYRVTFELDGTGMYKLEHALKLLEKYDPVGFEERPEDIDCWDDVCDEDAPEPWDPDEDLDCEKAPVGGWNDGYPSSQDDGCLVGKCSDEGDGEWNDDCSNDEVDKGPEPAHYHYIMPAHIKYILKYR